MAEGLARHLRGEEFEVFSAGTAPHGLNPSAVKVMAELGIDISQQTSKHLDSFQGQSFDLVVTVCDDAHERCPYWPGSVVLHQSFEDPPRLARAARSEEEALSFYRRVRDQIREFIETLPS
jgi:arsenate reductase